MYPPEKQALNAIEARIATLESALRECRSILALCPTKATYPKDTPEYAPVMELCKHYGYGAVMSSASSQWMESLEQMGYPPGGAFVAGPCADTIEYTIQVIDSALAGGTDCPHCCSYYQEKRICMANQKPETCTLFEPVSK